MNSANFHDYLKNPSKLHQVSYQELKSLMLQYPYAANLRYLMLIKSLFDKNKEYDKNLVLASLSSIDRGKLRQLVNQYSHLESVAESMDFGEEFLELKDLSTIEEVAESLPAEQEQLKSHSIDLGQPSDEPMLELLDETDAGIPIAGAAVIAGVAGSMAGDSEESFDELTNLEDILEEASPIDGIKEEGALDNLPEIDLSEGEAAESESLQVIAIADELEDLEIEEDLDGLFDVDFIEDPLPSESTDDELLSGEAEEATPDNITAVLEEAETVVEEDTLIDGLAIDGEEREMPSVSIDEELLTGAAEEALPENAKTVLEESEITDLDGLEDVAEEVAISAEDIPFEITNEEEVAAPSAAIVPMPSPKTDFDSWKKKMQPAKSGILGSDFDAFANLENEEEPEPYDEPEDVAKEVAADSLQEDLEIATETLAGVLERQGHFAKAAKMYEKLMLQYPEKSSFFAAKIEKLKNK